MFETESGKHWISELLHQQASCIMQATCSGPAPAAAANLGRRRYSRGGSRHQRVVGAKMLRALLLLLVLLVTQTAGRPLLPGPARPALVGGTGASDECKNGVAQQKEESDIVGNRFSTVIAVTAAAASSSSLDGNSDTLASVFNLAKTILGAGVLALPSGVAAFSDKRIALVPASGLLVFMSIMSAYSFASIGHACRLHDTRTFSDAWAKSVGPRYKVVISSVITFKTFFACLAFSIIIGDSFSSIMKSVGASSFFAARNNVILGLTTLVIFPLCMLKNMDALKYTSVLGLGGISYCALFIATRFFDGSYRVGGKYFRDISASMQPSFGQRLPGSTPVHVIFVLIAMISTAFSAHYNAPKFWIDLKNKTAARYNKVVSSAFLFAAITYMSVMWAGFLTFGGHSTGFILNNYSSKDIFATLARLAVGLAILFGYPLTFSALREGAFDLMKLPATGEARKKALVPVTVSALSLITSLALVIKNLGIVVALSGALIGALLIYFVPAVMNLCNIRSAALTATAKKNKGAAVVFSRMQQLEMTANYVMAFSGIVIAVIGVATTLMGSSAH